MLFSHFKVWPSEIFEPVDPEKNQIDLLKALKEVNGLNNENGSSGQKDMEDPVGNCPLEN